MLVAALQRIGGDCRQGSAWVQGGGDLYGVLSVDGAVGSDPEGLGPVEEHGEGAGLAVSGDGKKGHTTQLVVPC